MSPGKVVSIETRYTATGRDPRIYNCPGCDGMGFLPGGVKGRKKDERCELCCGSGRRGVYRRLGAPLYDTDPPRSRGRKRPSLVGIRHPSKKKVVTHAK